MILIPLKQRGFSDSSKPSINGSSLIIYTESKLFILILLYLPPKHSTKQTELMLWNEYIARVMLWTNVKRFECGSFVHPQLSNFRFFHKNWYLPLYVNRWLSVKNSFFHNPYTNKSFWEFGNILSNCITNYEFLKTTLLFKAQ